MMVSNTLGASVNEIYRYSPLLNLAGTKSELIRRVPPEDRLPYWYITIINLFICLSAAASSVYIAIDSYSSLWIGLLIALGILVVYCFLFIVLYRWINKNIYKIGAGSWPNTYASDYKANDNPLLAFIIGVFFIFILNAFAVVLFSGSIFAFIDENKSQPSSTEFVKLYQQIENLTNQIHADSVYINSVTQKLSNSKNDKKNYKPLSLSSPYLSKKYRELDSLKQKKDTLAQDLLAAQNYPVTTQRTPLYIFYILLIAFFILFNSSLIISYLRRKDFYHSLLYEDERVKLSILEESRSYISNTFKLESRVSQTKGTFSKIDYDDIEWQEIKNNLGNDSDVIKLEALVDAKIRIREYDEALQITDDIIKWNPELPFAWKKRAELFNLTGKLREAAEAIRRYSELEAKVQFKANLDDNILLKKISINNMSAYPDIDWDLQDGINILLGRNGYRKSHLMAVVLALLQSEEDQLKELIKPNEKDPRANEGSIEITFLSANNFDQTKLDKVTEQIKKVQQQRLKALEKSKELMQSESAGSEQSSTVNEKPSIESEKQSKRMEEIQDELRGLQKKIQKYQQQLIEYSGIGYSKFTNLGFDCTAGKLPVFAIPDMRFINKSVGFTTTVTDERVHNLLENGAYHFIFQLPFEGMIQNFLNVIASNYLIYGNFNDEIFQLINRVFLRLTGETFEWIDIKLSDSGSGFSIKVKTESGYILPVQKVSQGTLSVISIVGLIFHYLSIRYPNLDRKLLGQQKSIIFIDEIDAHLHPIWQQKIIGILKKEFPNVQFIISAHSPQIVAGCKEGEVSVIRKTNDNKFGIKTLQENFIGIPIDEIFKRVFETEEKDETFREIAAMLPFKDVMLKRINELNAKKSITLQEQNELLKIQDQMDLFIYFDQVNTDSERTDKLVAAQARINMLEIENQALISKLSPTNPNS